MQEGGKKSVLEIIREGREWCEKKRKEGWQDTPDGLMPLSEVKKAGYTFKDDQWMIPAEEYIADGNWSRTAGEKYIGPSRRYLDWLKSRRYGKVQKKEDKQLEMRDMPKPVFKAKSNDEIDIDDIPF